jgi:hypothetical protein
VTVIGPVVAPTGTVALIFEYDMTEKEASTPLKATDVAPWNALPWMVTTVPMGPLVGMNPVIFGLTLNDD